MLNSERKRHLREDLLAQRMRLSQPEVNRLSKKIINKLIRSIEWDHIKTIHLYLPIEKNNEINTWPIIDFLNKKYPKIRIYIPHGKGFSRFNPSEQIQPNNLGIPEPIESKIMTHQDFDLVITPLLGFNKSGYRLGYGGGYYDKLLANNDCNKAVGLSYAWTEIDNFPIEPHDQKLNLVITDKKTIDF